MQKMKTREELHAGIDTARGIVWMREAARDRAIRDIEKAKVEIRLYEKMLANYTPSAPCPCV